MTQEASPKSVVGAFDGRIVTFQGISARPVRRGDSFFVDYLNPAGDVFRSLEVLRTVGSHRYQQYLVDGPNDDADNYYRIPLARIVATAPSRSSTSSDYHRFHSQKSCFNA